MIESLLHPDLRNPHHKDYRKAIIVAWGILLIFAFFIPYTLYFYINYPDDIIKNITNAVGYPFFLGIFISLRKISKLNPILGTLNVTCYPLTLVSIYQTGGIYSADITWLMLTVLCAFIFIDSFWGIISTCISVVAISILYYQERQGNTSADYEKFVLQPDSNHYFFTWIFLFILVAVLLVAFNKILTDTNHKLDELRRQKIDELEIMLKKRTREFRELRAGLAKDFHDEMGNKLAGISILSQSVRVKLLENKSEETGEMLKTIELRAGELYAGTKDFIWTIDLNSDYVSEFFEYIREFGEVFFNELNISFLSECNIENAETLRLPTGYVRRLVPVCKEIMTNAATHSGTSAFEFGLRHSKSDNLLILTLSDSGKGFEPDNVKKRGLKNISHRLESIHANLKLHTAPGAGTRYVIALDITHSYPTRNG